MEVSRPEYWSIPSPGDLPNLGQNMTLIKSCFEWISLLEFILCFTFVFTVFNPI